MDIPKGFGIMWNAWSLEASSLSVRKVRLSRMKKKAFCLSNNNPSDN